LYVFDRRVSKSACVSFRHVDRAFPGFDEVMP